MHALFRSLFRLAAAGSLSVVAATALRAAAPVAELKVEIPFQRFVLTNGLTLLVHEDHKAPIVAVNVWYHVGSKNERAGKTGFAHLFEHLMFTGSENFRGSGDQRAFFETMERIGATDLNGTTNPDRTDYFENVPKNALDLALWIESDRMGHLLGAIDKAKLDTQRGVVQNEKRQGENQPYGVVEELVTRGTAPPGHPYSWTVIGSMEDLNAASLEDVQTWFKTYYGPANTVLVLAGDIDAETARRKVEQYFGAIPPGPPVARFDRWVPSMPGERRQSVADRVPQARLYKVWNVPAYGEADATWLGLVGDVLATGKTSRLYKRLVYEEQIATDVSASVDEREISSQFAIVVTAKPGEGLARIEQAVNEEVDRLLRRGISKAELERAKARRIAGFVRGIERIGGFGGKSDILAMNQTFRGDPGFFQVVLDQVRRATPRDLAAAARRWINGDVYVLEVHPFPPFEAAAGGADRSKAPVPGAPPEVSFPTLQRTQLANGLKVVLAERHAVPVVQFALQVDAGYAADLGGIPGTARLAMDLIDEGAGRRNALEISDELALLGAGIGAGSNLDTSQVYLSSLTTTLDRSLELYADVVLRPTFAPADFDRLRQQLVAAIQQERTEPFGIALRVFPGLLYGPGHAYGNPASGSGTEASVARITRDDVVKFHRTWFKPNHATMVVVGDTTLPQILPKLEKLFGAWTPGDVPAKNIATPAALQRPAIYLIDRPDSQQSVILAGSLAPPKANPDEIGIEAANTILGGAFSSRLNLNLREEKHWCYGAGSFVWPARGPRSFIAYAPVQTDKTKESLIEIDREFRGILGGKPITRDEVTKAQESQTLQLPGAWETMGAVGDSLGEIVRFGLPDDYFITYPGKVRALTVESTSRAVGTFVRPDQVVWVVVGDRAKVEPGLKELGWGEVRLLDADGQPAK